MGLVTLKTMRIVVTSRYVELRKIMNLTKILEDLRRERAQIDEAILSLERLAAGSGPRRGRPPAWLKDQKTRGRAASVKESASARSVSGN